MTTNTAECENKRGHCTHAHLSLHLDMACAAVFALAFTQGCRHEETLRAAIYLVFHCGKFASGGHCLKGPITNSAGPPCWAEAEDHNRVAESIAASAIQTTMSANDVRYGQSIVWGSRLHSREMFESVKSAGSQSLSGVRVLSLPD